MTELSFTQSCFIEFKFVKRQNTFKFIECGRGHFNRMFILTFVEATQYRHFAVHLSTLHSIHTHCSQNLSTHTNICICTYRNVYIDEASCERDQINCRNHRIIAAYNRTTLLSIIIHRFTSMSLSIYKYINTLIHMYTYI